MSWEAFSTDAGGGERWQNLKTGVEKLNGTILMPGESLSVCKATAPYDAEHGYVEAGSYENGQVVDSYGGGICQVSTTLYNAVLYAELQVDQRYPHSMLVNYVKPSRDAAIAEGILDFVFTNNYKTPVYIAGEIDDANQMRFTIYGKDERPRGRTVEYESETLETQEYAVTYQEDPAAALGSIRYSGSPHTGTTAQLWKVVYQDGVEESREVINHSVYEKSDQIILVGTKSEDPDRAARVRDAIVSQDPDRITAAVNQ
ncbi:VanW family protein [uncultured Merdimonas sp.]|uniref:VanW family protein n=1 Tax=uncultured Merdimonas sp. TaxID=2023269 RepID=UPI003209A718